MIEFGGAIYEDDFTNVRGTLKVKQYNHIGNLQGEAYSYYKVTDNEVVAIHIRPHRSNRIKKFTISEWKKLVAYWQADTRLYEINKIV